MNKIYKKSITFCRKNKEKQKRKHTIKNYRSKIKESNTPKPFKSSKTKSHL